MSAVIPNRLHRTAALARRNLARLGEHINESVAGSVTIAGGPTAGNRATATGARSSAGCPPSRLFGRAALPLIGALLLPLAAAAQPIEMLAPLDASAPITYSIAAARPESAYRDGDDELCSWALDDWARASGGRLEFRPSAEEEALVQVHFVAPSFGQYGEMRPLQVGGRRGAVVFIRPDTDALGPDIGAAARADPLLRDAIVYLTCLHELGHALGLEHTDRFDDVMYFFGFGGDIPAFFGRYRKRLADREDIATTSGLSDGDRARLRALYGL